jgi:hypothetical protein
VEPQTVWDNPDAFQGKPFVELINFADNEGAIGPETSRKLAQDFDAHSDHFRQLMSTELEQVTIEAERFIELYNEFHRAFEVASDDGFVVFE